ncbi:alpha/beta fold hydrolase [Aquimarina sp. D1M17]|uniref:alpha/beta hydrolase family protein n=1 Tax=Aquimarina acroporae TaxID=2937283 RepID=UPI0020BE83F0|nr:alpha/beta fold hydrolase [Aquimarina acroporae]MCK8523596.1 alpha/beta fold hydrolase [Aquimarina acroporae]
MIKNKKNYILEGKHNKPILADVFFKEDSSPKPIVVFCHGYKGFKDWGAWDLVANAFASAGFFFVKFNFSHNGGTIEQPIDFPDLEAFGNNTYLIELDDLELVLDWVTSANFDFSEELDAENITLIGHSRGGGIVTIKAAEDTRVTKVISWAGVSDYKARFPQGEVFDQWKSKGVYFIENGRTKQQMPHYFKFYTSFIEHEERLTIERATRTIKVPHLIIHGTNDPTVSPLEAELLSNWNPNSELFLVEGADHVFGAKHPWESRELSKNLDIITQKSIEFAIL